MEKHSKDCSKASSEFLEAGWFDPIEAAIRVRVRGFIEELVDAELNEALGRSRYRRPVSAEVAGGSAGYRHGRRDRRLLGSFGPVTISVPRARLNEANGTLLGTAPDQAGVTIVSGRLTTLAPITFTFGVTPKSTLVLKLSTGMTTNCGPGSSGGAGITGNTISLARVQGGCAPVVFTRQRGAEQRGTYQVNCSSPEIAPCIEKDETLTTTLDRGSYIIRARGKIGVLECWVRDDTLDIPVGGAVTRTLGLQRANAAGCPP